ncbi:MAG: Nif3-like dinuclear metal center hexameric protein [Rubrobacter sp.]|nr:Nif3-like dinuclear metal center hexameric protein [Rubrobacter sp.]
MTTYTCEVAEAVERIAPSALAEDWDNPGLQVGDPHGVVDGILVALTPLPEVFDEVEETGANFLLFHHPLIFQNLKSVNKTSYPGDLISRAVRYNLTVYAAHTNYDAAPEGVSVALADSLGLEGLLRVVVPRGSLRKLVVFVPEENANAMVDVLAKTGADIIGRHTYHAFPAQGTGSYADQTGQSEQALELRLEAVIPDHAALRAVTAARAAHPYEEPIIDVYPVDGHPKGCGYGRLGRLPEPLTPEELCDHVWKSLGFPARLVANPDAQCSLRSVAVLGGSGGSFVREAAFSDADAYITGDLNYHEGLLAESLGLVAIDAGHAATELPSLEPLAQRLAELVDVPVSVSRVRR